MVVDLNFLLQFLLMLILETSGRTDKQQPGWFAREIEKDRWINGRTDDER